MLPIEGLLELYPVFSDRNPEISQEVLGKVHYTEYLLSLAKRQERYTCGQKHKRRCSTSTVTRELEIRTTVTHLLDGSSKKKSRQ